MFTAIITVLIAICAIALILQSRRVEIPARFSMTVNDDIEKQVLSLTSKSLQSAGGGISLRKIKRTINATINELEKVDDADKKEYEQILYNGFRQITNALDIVKERANEFARVRHSDGYALICIITDKIVFSTDGDFDCDTVMRAVRAYQTECELTYNELSLLPTSLLYSSLRFVELLCKKILALRELNEAATSDAQKERLNLSLLDCAAYVTKLFELSALDDSAYVKATATANGIDLQKSYRVLCSQSARLNIRAANILRSLNAINRIDERDLLLNLSKADKVLSNRCEPYRMSDKETKLYFLEKTARLARKKKTTESAYVVSTQDKQFLDRVFPPYFGKVAQKVYISFQLIICVAAAIAVGFAFGIAIGVLSVFIAFPIVRTIFNRCARFKYLPTAEVNENEKTNTTIVALCQIVGNADELNTALEKLKTLRCANPQKNLRYALIADLPQASCANMGDDYALLDIIKKFCKDNDNRYIVAVRKRVKIGKAYGARERKRGAIEDFFKAVIGDNSDYLYFSGDVSAAQFCIVLDQDGMLNCAQELVSAMIHPLNTKYNIIPLNMVTSSFEQTTPFSRLQNSGLSGYQIGISNDESDFFDCGNFTGKGIYRIKECYYALKDRLPNNKILSHDFLEGAIVGCRNSKFYGYDAPPLTFSSYIARHCRWVRGDWQLLPYLFPRVKNKADESIKNPLSSMARYHILSSMLYSLQPIAALGIIIAAIFSPHTYYALFIAFAYYLLSFLVSLATRNARGACFVLIEVMALPTVAAVNAYSIVVTLIRLARKKNLLRWSTFGHAHFIWSAAINLLFCAVLAAISILFSRLYMLAVAAYFALFAIFEHLLSINVEPRTLKRSYLTSVVKSTWEFFKANFTAENNYLPCDNYDEISDRWAQRTSPTNIGFALVSTVCAHALNFIDDSEARFRTFNILHSIDKCEKWNGCLFNWIDTKTLKTLPPRFVSTVDNGNLLMCLALTGAYFGNDILSFTSELIAEADMSKLFDKERNLFYIGYDCDKHEYANAHYDLTSSEALLTYIVSVGYGKADKKSFDALNKKCVKYAGSTMYSWTGGAFEYLMSSLFMSFPKGSLLHKSCANAVRAQMKYARQNKTEFFGISESQYNFKDEHGNYQYKAFGVPQIAYDFRGFETVCAPYASALCLSYDDRRTLKNFTRIDRVGMRGNYGWYEAWDEKPIKTYMAHHQGMIMLSLSDYLLKEEFKRTLKKLPQIASTDGFCMRKYEVKKAKKSRHLLRRSEIKMPQTFTPNRTALPQVKTMSNGMFNVLCDADGGCKAVYDHVSMNRYNRRGDGYKVFAIVENVKYELNAGKISFGDGVISQHCTDAFLSVCKTLVLPVYGMAREVKFKNLSKRPMTVRFSTYSEVLISKTADDSHKAFSDMHVFTENKGAYITATRNDRNLIMCHKIAVENVVYECSKNNYFNRGKMPSFGYTLNPILSGEFYQTVLAGEEFAFYVYDFADYDSYNIFRLANLCSQRNFYLKSAGGLSALRHFAVSKECEILASYICFNKQYPIDVKIAPPLPTVIVEYADDIVALESNLRDLFLLSSYDIGFNVAIIYSESESKNSIESSIEKMLANLDFMRCGIRPILVNELIDTKLAKRLRALNCTQRDNKPLPSINRCSHGKGAGAQKFNYALRLGMGGFVEDGAYAIPLSHNDTPAPWSNIISDGKFGTLITESGGGFTFADNSRENKLTQFYNDAVKDEPSEFVVIQDGNVVWSITKKPIDTGCASVVHGLGYTTFFNSCNGINAALTECIALNKRAKLYICNFECSCNKTIDVMFAAYPVLGASEQSVKMQMHNKCLEMIGNATGERAYIQTLSEVESVAFFSEAFAERGVPFTAKPQFNDGSTPCGSISVKVKLCKSETTTVVFSLGDDINLDDYQNYLDECKTYFSTLSRLRLDGDGKIVEIVNRMPYQVLSSRFNARCGFYQVGGAYGFRDQLQDCLCLKYVSTALVKEHILHCAARQFIDGDVLHWWHPPFVGVRTKITDDRLFLPLIVCDYIGFTGNRDILKERVPYLKSVAIPKGAKDVYAQMEQSDTYESLLAHCIRAIESVSIAENGLVLMGTGDWNDGMDKIGANGKGTTVWGTAFLRYVILKFLPLVKDSDIHRKWAMKAYALKNAVQNTWDGKWFARAYDDDGMAIGVHDNDECKIDLISQCFCILADIATPEQTESALNAVEDLLWDKKEKIIKLLDPPFAEYDAGYISKYPPYVRENGGQYTHAAVWYVLALLKAGKYDKAYKAFCDLNPIEHSDEYDKTMRYAVEPYVLSADVYGGQYCGRGGWSWYTGSASWYYVVFIEAILGISIRNNTISVNPKLPQGAPSFKVQLRCEFGTVDVFIDNSGSGEWGTYIGKTRFFAPRIKLTYENTHRSITIKKS